MELGDPYRPKAKDGEIIPPRNEGKIRDRGRPFARGNPGKPKGARNKATVANLLKARETLGGLSPLDILLEQGAMARKIALRLYEDHEDPESFQSDEFLKYSGATVDALSKAAAYCHPKVAPKPPTPDLPQFDIGSLSNEQLGILIVRIRDRLSSTGRAGGTGAIAGPTPAGG